MSAGLRNWLVVAVLAGIAYVLIGRVFAWPANHVQAWRLAAWVASGVVFAAHIAHEHFRFRDQPRTTAFHAAVAVAIGGFGLAVMGMLNSLSATSSIRPNWLLALVLWPAFTALPAFVVAFVVASLLERIPRRADVR